MNRLATTLGAAALLLAPVAAQAQLTFQADWQQTAAAASLPSYFGTNTERGFAVGTYAGNPALIVLSRNTANFFRVHNPETGALTASFSGTAAGQSFAGVTGGLITINDIALTPNGKVVGCNVVSGTPSTPGAFKCYTWTDLSTAPITSLTASITPTSGTSRVGDAFTISGTGDNLTLWLPSSGAPAVYKFTTTDGGTTWSAPTVLPLGLPAGVTTTGTVPSVSPLSDGRFWFKSSGRGAYFYNADGTLVGQIPTTTANTGVPTTTQVPFGSSAIKAFTADTPVGIKDFLAVYQFLTGSGNATPSTVNQSRVLLYEIDQTTGTGTRIASLPVMGTVANGNGAGDIDVVVTNPPAAFGNSTVAAAPQDAQIYVLGTNNGIARYSNTTPLPVEMSSFTAAADGSSAAVLRWVTESETDNAGFSVETLRGSSWTELAFVAGRGTTAERASYERRIEGLAPGTHRFRLVQRDLDGTATVAGTVEVTIGQTETLALSVRSNATDAPTLALVARESGTADVTVYDVTGRTVARYAVSADAGARTDVAVAGLAAGVYVVRATGRTGSAATTLVVR